MNDLFEHAENWVQAVLRETEQDPNDLNFLDTPRRVAGVYGELLYGHTSKAQVEIACHMSKMFPTEYDGMVVVRDISSVGVCPHHLLPVIYQIHFAYVPEGVALGLSKIPRVIKLLGARAVLQEDFTHSIMTVFQSFLKPRGIATIVEGVHTCMSIRGVKESGATTVTAQMSGLFLENVDGIKDEFMSHVQGRERR